MKVQTQHSSSQSPRNKKIWGMKTKENHKQRFPSRMLTLQFMLQVILDTILKTAQDGLQKYPTWQFGNQQRSFNKIRMDQYSWLEYSVAKDAAFCFACRHFLKRGHGFNLEPTFTSNGFNNWRASLKSHHESMGHKTSMEGWSEFKQ